MTRKPCTITTADVDRSYEVAALLEVCKGAAEQVREQTPAGHQLIELVGALPSVIQVAIDKWTEVHLALEGAERDNKLKSEQERQP